MENEILLLFQFEREKICIKAKSRRSAWIQLRRIIEERYLRGSSDDETNKWSIINQK